MNQKSTLKHVTELNYQYESDCMNQKSFKKYNLKHVNTLNCQNVSDYFKKSLLKTSTGNLKYVNTH